MNEFNIHLCSLLLMSCSLRKLPECLKLLMSSFTCCNALYPCVCEHVLMRVHGFVCAQVYLYVQACANQKITSGSVLRYCPLWFCCYWFDFSYFHVHVYMVYIWTYVCSRVDRHKWRHKGSSFIALLPCLLRQGQAQTSSTWLICLTNLLWQNPRLCLQGWNCRQAVMATQHLHRFGESWLFTCLVDAVTTESSLQLPTLLFGSESQWPGAWRTD